MSSATIIALCGIPLKCYFPLVMHAGTYGVPNVHSAAKENGGKLKAWLIEAWGSSHLIRTHMYAGSCNGGS
jgi:hypothetical protein